MYQSLLTTIHLLIVGCRIFYINLPICIPTTIGVYLFLKPAPMSSVDFLKLKYFDWTGMVILTGSLISILYGLTSGGSTLPWSSASIITSLCIGAAGVAATMCFEGIIAKNPMLPPRIFRSRTATFGYLTSWCLALTLWSYAYFMPLYVRLIQQLLITSLLT